MVGFDVGDEHGVARQSEERAVALVGLDDDPLAAYRAALVPRSATMPPATKLGRSPAARSTAVTMPVVVVLPCVPETAIACGLVATTRRSASARDSTGIARRRASTTSGFVSRTAVEMAIASQSAGTCSARWPTKVVMPSAASVSSSFEWRWSEPVTRCPSAWR